MTATAPALPRPATPPARDAHATLAASFDRHLAAENASPQTRRTYAYAVRVFDRYLTLQGMPRAVAAIHREHVEAFLVASLETRTAATALTRYKGVRAFFGWLVEEGELKASPMQNVKPPKLPEAPPPVLSDDQLGRLLKACAGADFEARRDTAIIRLLMATGMRRAEIGTLKVEDIDFTNNVAFVMGKGRRARACPFGPKAARAIDRYLRARDQHRAAASPILWLGKRGPLRPDAIADVVKRRAREAGIDGLHAHLFRHTYAHQWLAAGGQEQDLMRLGGWRSREIMARYGASAADERAREAYRRLAVGEQF